MTADSRITVIGEFRKSGRIYCECVCACGTRWITRKDGIASGATLSCGCLHKERVTTRLRQYITKHGLNGTKINTVWKGMVRRCYNTHGTDYRHYGGRGIRVCEFLRASPANLLFVIGEPPSGYTLERIDNNSHYSCGQCADCLRNYFKRNIRWATRYEQSQNTRRNHKVEIGGEIRSVAEWSRISGVHKSTIISRLNAGMSGQCILVHHKRGWRQNPTL